MCGIIGIIDFDKKQRIEDADKMISTLKHRGPDFQKSVEFTSPHASVFFSHARLSIIDLSEGANQPMQYKQYTIIFNGEIYNFKEIKKDLINSGHVFLLDSDTEVILHAYEEWGTECLSIFIGMFAFAIFDNNKQEIFFARDRTGVKPLYIYNYNNIFLFASELKAFTVNKAFMKELDMNAVSAYFKWSYIPAPFSIYKNTTKLLSGHYGILNLKDRKIKLSRYWDVLDYYKLPIQNIPYNEAKNRLEKILISSCNYRMFADVPVGVFLSGGYDSAGITAILQKERTEKLKTFTIGFEEGVNEAPYAKQIADYIGTDHTEYICTNSDAYDLFPEIPVYYDEPYADTSSIPTMLVAQIARRNVTVALSADGGDEVFGGYTHYVNNNMLYHQFINISKMPFNSSFIFLLKKIAPKYYSTYNKLELFQTLLNEDEEHRFSILCENLSCSESLFKGLLKDIQYPSHTSGLSDNLLNDKDNIPLAMDYNLYLQDNIFTKVDRATMRVGLEGREPLIDHRLIEFMAQLPYAYKYDGKVQKRIYRDIVHKYIPNHLMERPKTGFGAPLFNWLKKDLSWLLEDYIKIGNLNNKIFNINNVLALKKKFFENNLSYSQQFFLWKILSFQMWYKKWMM